MPFDSLCRNKIFKDVANYEDIKVDKFMHELFSSVFTGMGGRYTRLRIICAITENPINAQELSKKGVKVYSVDAYLKPHEPIASPADLTPRFGEGSYEDAKSRAVLGLAEHLPFKDESFDLVISLFAVPYYSPNEENLEQELREMVRVLKPGGEIQLAPVFMYALLNKSNSSDRENAWHVMQVASRVIPSIPDCVFETEPYKEKVLTQRLIIRKRKTN